MSPSRVPPMTCDEVRERWPAIDVACCSHCHGPLSEDPLEYLIAGRRRLHVCCDVGEELEALGLVSL